MHVTSSATIPKRIYDLIFCNVLASFKSIAIKNTERVHFKEMYVHSFLRSYKCSNLRNIREIVCTLLICSYAPLRSIMIDCKPWYVHKLIDYAYTLLPNLEITVLLFHFLPLRNATLMCSKHTLFGQRKSKFFTLVHVVRDIYDFFVHIAFLYSWYCLFYLDVCHCLYNHDKPHFLQ